MNKNKWTVVAILSFFFVHTALCDFYILTYFKSFEIWAEVLPKAAKFAVLIAFFLFAPACYYIVGRIFRNRINKKAYLIATFGVGAAIAFFGAFSMLTPALYDVYVNINAPACLYYNLFDGAVFYISVPAMLASGVLPAFCARTGLYHKGRQHNEVKTESDNAVA